MELNPFRPIIATQPDMPHPESQDYADLMAAQRPNPLITGECQTPTDRKSLLCTGWGMQREDPLQMLNAQTAFKSPLIQCDPCYGKACDEFIERSHAR